ncbi:MAG TPA: hypothetical protein VFM29_02625, partial [Vicinamibacteria bacterium]|nr:hypothetical protein [Vicinamibacteria bacterium]
MGMSLPLLVRGLVRDRAGAARTIGYLYGANALGAAVGAFLTPWVLLRYLAVTGAVHAGAAGSAVAGLGALLIGLRMPETADAAPSEPGPAPVEHEPAQPFSRWVALYALSGFVSLSLEMVWFRVLDVAAKGAAFTFGTLLAIYLFGLAAGTFVAARRAASIRRPLFAFLLCQVGIVLATLVTHGLLAWLPADWPVLSALARYGTRYYGLQMHAFNWPEFLAIYVALPFVLFGPSTFLMGFGFPILQRATQSDPAASGHKVGVLQAANIAGCTLGSLLTGLVLFDLVGTAGVFKVLAVVSVGVALLGLRATGDRRFAALAAALAVAALVFPGRDRLWLRLHGAPPPDDAFVEEDAAGVTALTPRRGGYNMAINGRAESWLPYGYLHTVIGALAAVAHPNPVEAAVIGLGSGDTAWAAAARAETQRVVVFEIASTQPRLLGRVADKPNMAKLRQFLADPRFRIVKDDGRRRLRSEPHAYDIIVADSIDPDLSLSAHIYSVEHYRLVRDRLKPGGLICVLAKTPRIRAALHQVFPHTVMLREDLLLASPQPIPLEKEAWLERLRSPHMVEYLGRARTQLVAGFVENAQPGVPMPPGSEVNRDLEPLDEFARPYEVTVSR